MSRGDIQRANQEVPIMEACNLIGLSLDYGYSGKTYCPFGDVSHADGGQAKSFRVYFESNTAYCFACAERYTPVKLVALEKDISFDEAAAFLLEAFQIKRASIDDQWRDLTEEKPFSLNASDLAEALKVYCRRIEPDWESRQFEPEIAESFQRCLTLIAGIRTEEDKDMWREATKTFMKHRLGKDHG